MAKYHVKGSELSQGVVIMRRFARKWFAGFTLAVVGSVVLAGTALALTTFDPTCSLATSNSSGACGFVGKGDVQVPWVWNNQTLQAQAGNVTFAYNKTDSADYNVTCEFDTGTIHVVHHVIHTTAGISDAVAFDVTGTNRTNPQLSVTGFKLTGKTNLVSSGDTAPAVGDPCPGNSALGAVTAVSDPYNQSSTQELDASDAALSLGPTPVWVNGVSVSL